MKTSLVEKILIFALLIGLLIVTFKVNKQLHEPQIVRDTVYSEHVLTDILMDTIYVIREDTVMLPVVVSDTIIDTFPVIIPVQKYTFDTCVVDTIQTHGDTLILKNSLKGILSGFNVEMEQLTISNEIVSRTACLPPKTKSWWQRFTPAVGVGYGTGGFGIFVGVGYSLR